MPELEDLTVGTTEVELVGAELTRAVLMIQNTHATAIIKISEEKGGTAIKGVRVFSKDFVIFDWFHGDKPEKRRYVVSDTADTVVARYYETLEIKPPPGPNGEPTPPVSGGALLPLLAAYLLAHEKR